MTLTNQTKKHHKLFAREKTDLFRWLDMSGVKDGNTKNRLKKYTCIQSDSYHHVVSLCCFKKCENTTKKARKICVNVQLSLICFASFMKKLKERDLSRTTASLMYFANFRMGRRTKK